MDISRDKHSLSSKLSGSVIRSGDLVLRSWVRADEPAITKIVEASQFQFADWLPELASELTDFDKFIEATERSAREGTGWTYCIQVDGVIVGQCDLKSVADRSAEVGYWVRTDRTGEGIATRAVCALCSAATAHGLKTLVIHCDEGNIQSAAVARKAGFTHVKTVDLDPSVMGTRAQTGREMTWRLELDGKTWGDSISL